MLGPWKHGKGILREENENRDKVEEILDPSSEQVSQQYTGHMTFSQMVSSLEKLAGVLGLGKSRRKLQKQEQC